MLSPRYLAGCSDDIVQLYAQLESDIIRDMARRLSKMQSVTEATLWQAQILRETGSFTQNISKYLDKYNEQAKTLIQNLFNEAMIKAQQSDIAVLQNGLDSMSDNQKQALESLVQKTSSAGIVTGSKKVVQETAAGGAIKVFSGLQRLTMTIANTAQNDFIQQANNAYMQVVTGAFDYKTALKNSVNALAEKGIHTVEYTDSGKSIHRTIESAVRANILTGINQTASQQTRNNCAELGTDLVEVSAHMGAREEHAAWQGKVFSLSGGAEKYPSFNDVCKPGTPSGIGGINCRHSYYPYFEGMELHYSNGELDEMREPKVTYNGKQITQYEAEQKLRGVERNIRKFKLKAVALDEAGLDNTAERRKIGEWQEVARDIVTQTGIKRDSSREYVGVKNGGKQPTGLKPLPKTTTPISENKTPVMTSTTSVNTIVDSLIDNPKSNARTVLETTKVVQIEIKTLAKIPEDGMIIPKLSGGDKTKGSCSSLAFAYAANKGQLDITDYRGGDSRKVFSRTSNIVEIAKFNGVNSKIVTEKNDFMAVRELLKYVEDGKQYYFATGRHAAIIQKAKGGYEFLEMQSHIPSKNGFKELNDSVLKNRFGCQKSYTSYGRKLEMDNVLIEVKSLAKNKEFYNLMKYINTNVSDQQKGNTGGVK